MKLIHVKNVRHVGGCNLLLEFSDGTSGTADLAKDLNSCHALKPLLNEKAFAKAFLDRGTVCWSSDLDLAPERLYALAHGLPVPRSIEDVEANELQMSLRSRDAL